MTSGFNKSGAIIGAAFVAGAAVTGAYLLMTRNSNGNRAAAAVAPSSGKGQRENSSDVLPRTTLECAPMSMTVPPGWTFVEDNSSPPTSMTNTAMVEFTTPEFTAVARERGSQQQAVLSGAVPTVHLLVEDMLWEGNGLEEVSNYSKGMAFSQLGALAGRVGEPEITFEGAMNVGIFEHCHLITFRTQQCYLEVLTLVTIKEGLCFVLQLLGSPQLVSETKGVVMKLAASMQIEKGNLISSFNPDIGSSVAITTSDVQLSVPASWVPANPAKPALLAFRTQSMTKPELIQIFRAKNCPAKLPTDGKTIDTCMGEFKSCGVSDGTFSIVCAAEDRDAKSIVTPAQSLEMTLRGAGPSKRALPPVYRNVAQRCEFVLEPRYKLYEPRFGDLTVTYQPNAGSGQGPIPPGEDTFITVGAEDIRGAVEEDFTFDEFFTGLRLKYAAEAPHLKIQKVNVGINEAACVTDFKKDASVPQDVRQGKYHFFQNKRLTTIAWSCEGKSRDFDRKLDAMLASFRL